MKNQITREQAICDLRKATEDLCREIEHELAVGLSTAAHKEEATRLAPVIRSWLAHLRAWKPPAEPAPPVDPSIFD